MRARQAKLRQNWAARNARAIKAERKMVSASLAAATPEVHVFLFIYRVAQALVVLIVRPYAPPVEECTQPKAGCTHVSWIRP